MLAMLAVVAVVRAELQFALHLLMLGAVLAAMPSSLFPLPATSVAAAAGFPICYSPETSGIVVENTERVVQAAISADIDGDGDLDIVTVAHGNNRVSWYKNFNGAGSFTAQIVISTEAMGVVDVAATDLDSDGDLDVVVVSTLDNTVAWFENTDGTGLFSSRKIISSTVASVRALHVGDIDGDGDIDILAPSTAGDFVTWFENDGDEAPSFTRKIASSNIDSPACAFIADMNGDEHMDLVVCSLFDDGIYWLENDGEASTWTQHDITNTIDGPSSLHCKDFNGDGSIDVIAVSGLTNSIFWYDNVDGDGLQFDAYTVTNSVEGPRAAVAVNLISSNALYDDILVAGGQSDTVELFSYTSTSLVSAQTLISEGHDFVVSALPADIDDDGLVDLVVASQTDGVVAWYARESAGPSFGSANVLTPSYPDGPTQMVAADVDGDGTNDIVLSAIGGIYWYKGSSSPQLDFSAQQTIVSERNLYAYSIDVADLDGDGDMDVVAALYLLSRVVWYENNGQGGFSSAQPLLQQISAPRFVHAVDFTGDGLVDILCASEGLSSEARIALIVNSGSESADGMLKVATQDVSASRRPRVLGTCDIDGDGDLDIVAGSYQENRLEWIETAGSLFVVHEIDSFARQVTGLALGDVDGDGDCDIVSVLHQLKQVVWYENLDSVGNFSSPKIIASSLHGVFGVTLADLDKDGDLDVIAASLGDDTVQWFDNLFGNGTFSSAIVITDSLDGADSVIAADMDGDGVLEVVAASRNANIVAWFQGQVGFSRNATSAACADVDECETECLPSNTTFIRGCVNTPGSFVCECRTGFEYDADADACTVDIDECEDHCQESATGVSATSCTNFYGWFFCACPGGRLYNPYTDACELADLCDDMCSGPHTTGCTHSSQGFTCACDPGFQYFFFDDVCEDINECRTQCKGDNTASCTNTPGSFNCTCNEGYVYFADEDACVQDLCVGECQDEKSVSCTMTSPTAFTCTCEQGYFYHPSANVCMDVNECDFACVALDDHVQQCINTQGSFSCVCEEGYAYSASDDSCQDVDECSNHCSGNHTSMCVNTQGSFTCSCDEGFEYSAIVDSCEDVDECALTCLDTSTSVCMNTPGSYSCSCLPGFTEAASDGDICEDVDECLTLCQGTLVAECTNTPGSFVCECMEGYEYTADADDDCRDVNECLTMCSGTFTSTCTNTLGSFVCECMEGYAYDEENDMCVDVNECLTLCLDTSSSVCTNTDGGYICTCSDGYEYLGDGVCEDINECATRCVGNHVDDCENTAGSFECVCEEGYVFNYASNDCQDVNECATLCQGENTVSCANTAGSFECMCVAGYGYERADDACEDIDECQSACQENALSCTNSAGSFECTCNEGYTFDSNLRACVDLNECDFACQGNHTTGCENLDGSYQCTCEEGFYFVRGDRCRDINECDTRCRGRGSAVLSCTNTIGSFVCECIAGFAYNASLGVCKDVDECLDQCTGVGTESCTNTPGSFTCVCEAEYELVSDSAGRYSCIFRTETSASSIIIPAAGGGGAVLLVLIVVVLVVFLRRRGARSPSKRKPRAPSQPYTHDNPTFRAGGKMDVGGRIHMVPNPLHDNYDDSLAEDTQSELAANTTRAYLRPNSAYKPVDEFDKPQSQIYYSEISDRSDNVYENGRGTSGLYASVETTRSPASFGTATSSALSPRGQLFAAYEEPDVGNNVQTRHAWEHYGVADTGIDEPTYYENDRLDGERGIIGKRPVQFPPGHESGNVYDAIPSSSARRGVPHVRSSGSTANNTSNVSPVHTRHNWEHYGVSMAQGSDETDA